MRDYNVLTKSFSGRNGRVEQLNAVRVDWGAPDASGRPTMREMRAATSPLALTGAAGDGVHPPGASWELSRTWAWSLTGGATWRPTPTVWSSVPGVFAAGDTVRGASLVVWAIAEGRQAATA